MEVPQPTPAAEQPQRRSFARGCFRVVATLFVLLILVGVVGVIAAYRVYVSPIKASEPYKMALAQVQKAPKVVEALGSPIEDVFWPPPSSHENPGEATLNFEVAGPKGRAAVQAVARTIDGKWGLSLVLVTVTKTGERFRVDTQESSGLEEAPPFRPGG